MSFVEKQLKNERKVLLNEIRTFNSTSPTRFYTFSPKRVHSPNKRIYHPHQIGSLEVNKAEYVEALEKQQKQYQQEQEEIVNQTKKIIFQNYAINEKQNGLKKLQTGIEKAQAELKQWEIKKNTGRINILEEIAADIKQQ
ncbi:Hypothetical_protein [Hexamita inflata]|uniref:Hypothetical_protein n=1 Tax=Hexamita inflata TaxID=28002 RepID=A0AA86V3Y6_9EUKA|nr:Hypothetical protein HINF_LOCUS63181 [Hexamita inflata]